MLLVKTREEKQASFESYFLINHPTKVNIEPVNESEATLSLAEFEASMPYAFRIASELSEIESQALKPLRSLGDSLADLVDYLQLQARKIDLMMSYILLEQDLPEHRKTASKFGGGGVIIESETAVEIGSFAKIKIFLEAEAAAIYCVGEAIDQSKKDDLYQVSYVYTLIREQDQELLVRASLHLQTAQLRKGR
ncbi:PilZ domain-containing protein [Glaciecola sp. MH2013]|uniref:PilZ domain-containing protein n=1 Tax=Glaciecola sp. MH2013 TaxID=2785524 RepID=UPI0018A11439|nr:PilZ domain-containing protein [Glaciecola sp. MH2013]MBF7072961.1 PilZ domain-containing protein [Glaciecola sp. MH2013]